MKNLGYIFLLLSSSLFSQVDITDSVEHIIGTHAHDSEKVILLNQVAWELINRGEFKSAFTCLDVSEELAKKDNFKTHLARATVYKGIAYRMQGEFKDAIDYLSSGLKMSEQLNNLRGQATCLGNLGIIYENQQNFKKAFEYYTKALAIRTNMGDKQAMIFSYNDIAILFDIQKDPKNALTYFFKGLELGEEIGDSSQIALCWRSIGNCYLHSGEVVKAKTFTIKALNYYDHSGDKDGQCRAYCLMGEIERLNKNYKPSIIYFEKALELSQEINVKEIVRDASIGIAGSYYNLGDFKSAFDNQMVYIIIKDSILNSETTKLMAEMNSKYESEKKDKQILLQQAETDKQQLVKNGFIIGFGALAILMIFIFRGYVQKKKDNKIIQLQKTIVEEKQKEILDSIEYAKRIQTALMSNEKYIDNTLNRLNK